MKKVISLLLSIVMLISITVGIDLSVYAEELTTGKCGNNATYSFDSSTGTLTISGSGAIYDYSNSLTTPWRNSIDSIKKVIINHGITYIGKWTFYKCSSLTSASIPNSVTEIGNSAFYGCSNLTNISIPNGVIKIGSNIFGYCENLNSVVISKNIEHIEDTMFSGCTSLSSIYIYNPFCGIACGHSYNVTNHLPSNVTIYGYENSSALKCAAKWKIKIKSIGTYNCTVYGREHKYKTYYYRNAATDACTYQECSVCGDYKTVASKHKPNTIPKVNPTCTQPGSTESTYCEICGEILIEQTKISELGHKLGKWQPYGNHKTEKRNCSRCDYYELRSCTYKSTVTKPTCTEQGYKTHKCSSCGDVYKDEYVKAYGHDWKWRVVTAPKGCKDGLSVRVCNTCNEIEQLVIPASESHSNKKTITKATTKKNGKITKKCSKCGTSTTTTIYYPKTITLSATSYVYDGKVKKPTVTVKDSKGNKIATNNYTVTYASGRKAVGSYKVTIKFKGNYSGTVTKTFTIKPKATTLSSVSAKSKGFTAKWNKQATQTTGYQIQYSASSNFSNAKAVTVSKSSTTSKTVSKLNAKKKYYVRVRTYKTVKVNGKSTKIYSAWSGSKAVTTKK